jgi:hypothetical protein
MIRYSKLGRSGSYTPCLRVGARSGKSKRPRLAYPRGIATHSTASGPRPRTGSCIALAGWSFGGHLAPRAASGERRIAALIADPGQWDLIEAIRVGFRHLGVPEDIAAAIPDVDELKLQEAFAIIRGNSQLAWTFVQRGLWVHQVDTLMDYLLRACVPFRVSDRVSTITCPTLITMAENDPVAMNAKRLYDVLNCPETLVRFTAAEGAGDHCEGSARSVYFQRAYDWLDDIFGMR